MRGRFLIRLSAGQKGDARHGGGNARFEQTDGLLRNLFNRRRFCALLARDRHVGFQDHAFQRDALDPQFLERLVEDALGHLNAAVDVVIAVHQHFRLDDRHDLRGLAQCRITGQRMRVDADRGHARDTLANVDHRAPFRKARTALVIFLQPLGELVEAGGDRFARAVRQGLRSLIDLDAGDRA